ncbi:MAG: thioesterase family protein [Bacteroidales bacterium]|nr:thioesterase family protein [Bacteroidales bacterium]
MIETGIKGHKEQIVTPEMSAARVGSGLVDVFATPMLVALVEQTCYESVLPHLDEGQGTVGTLVNVSHLSATPIGKRVWCDSELTEVDRRRLVFSVKAYDEAGLIGEGTHERFVIDTAKFMDKLKAKS